MSESTVRVLLVAAPAPARIIRIPIGPPGPKGEKGDTGNTGATGATGGAGPMGVTAYSALTGVPNTFSPGAHKASHALGGSDALSPASIGAATPQDLANPILTRVTRTPGPLISFQLDDGYVQDRTVAYPIFNSRGLKASICCITSLTDDPTETTIMRWDDFRWFRDQGWDTASHTVNHRRLDELTDVEVEYECSESIRVMQREGLNPQTLVYPQAFHTAANRAIVKKYFRAGIAGIEPTEQNELPLRTFAVARRPIQNARTLAQYKADVDKCLAEGTWLVFIVHTGYDLDAIQQANLAALLDYIASKNIRVCTVAEGLDVYGNLYESGDTAGAHWSAVTASGDLTSSGAGKQRVADDGKSTVTGAGITSAAPITAFELGFRTYTTLNSVTAHLMPTPSGVLVTDRTPPQTLYPKYGWQEWRDYTTTKRWIRKAVDFTTWATWEPMDAIVVAGALNGFASTVGPDGFLPGKLTRYSVTSAGASGYPTTAGTIEVDTTVAIAAGLKFTRQSFRDYTTGTTYVRYAASATTWETAWTASTTGGGSVVVVSAVNSFTNTSLPSEFPASSISSMSSTTSAAGGFPTTAGTLVTDTTTTIAAGAKFTRQLWTDYFTGQKWTRAATSSTTWETAWTPLAIFTLPTANSLTNASLPSDFPIGQISRIASTAGGAGGFPTASGLLETDSTVSSGIGIAYTRQTWTDYGNSGLAYTRTAASSSTWNAWVMVNAALTQTVNTADATAVFTTYPIGVVSYATRTSNGTTFGFPTASGTLSTDRTNYTDGTAAFGIYVHQAWRDASTGKVWHRSGTSTSWTAWLPVSYSTVNIIKYAVAFNLGPIAAGAELTQDFTYTGVVAGDSVVLNASGIEAGLVLRGEAPAANTLRLIAYNATASSIDPANRTFTFRVIQ